MKIMKKTTLALTLAWLINILLA